jgi:hypothetical protein
MATFTGSTSMNLMEATISEDGTSFLVAGTSLALPSAHPDLAD